MKPRVEKRISIFDIPASALDGLRRGERVFSHKSVLLLALVLVSWQFFALAAPANGRGWQRPAHRHFRLFPFGRHRLRTSSRAGRLSRARSSNGNECVESESTVPEDEEKQPSPEGNNSSNSTSDLDESDSGLDDLSADNPTRTDQDTSHFSVAGLNAVILRAPGITHVFLLPVSCFYRLHDHVRERAPPILT